MKAASMEINEYQKTSHFDSKGLSTPASICILPEHSTSSFAFSNATLEEFNRRVLEINEFVAMFRESILYLGSFRDDQLLRNHIEDNLEMCVNKVLEVQISIKPIKKKDYSRDIDHLLYLLIHCLEYMVMNCEKCLLIMETLPPPLCERNPSIMLLKQSNSAQQSPLPTPNEPFSKINPIKNCSPDQTSTFFPKGEHNTQFPLETKASSPIVNSGSQGRLSSPDILKLSSHRSSLLTIPSNDLGGENADILGPEKFPHNRDSSGRKKNRRKVTSTSINQNAHKVSEPKNRNEPTGPGGGGSSWNKKKRNTQAAVDSEWKKAESRFVQNYDPSLFIMKLSGDIRKLKEVLEEINKRVTSQAINSNEQATNHNFGMNHNIRRRSQIYKLCLYCCKMEDIQ